MLLHPNREKSKQLCWKVRQQYIQWLPRRALTRLNLTWRGMSKSLIACNKWLIGISAMDCLWDALQALFKCCVILNDKAKIMLVYPLLTVLPKIAANHAVRAQEYQLATFPQRHSESILERATSNNSSQVHNGWLQDQQIHKQGISNLEHREEKSPRIWSKIVFLTTAYVRTRPIIPLSNIRMITIAIPLKNSILALGISRDRRRYHSATWRDGLLSSKRNWQTRYFSFRSTLMGFILDNCLKIFKAFPLEQLTAGIK